MPIPPPSAAGQLAQVSSPLDLNPAQQDLPSQAAFDRTAREFSQRQEAEGIQGLSKHLMRCYSGVQMHEARELRMEKVRECVVLDVVVFIIDRAMSELGLPRHDYSQDKLFSERFMLYLTEDGVGRQSADKHFHEFLRRADEAVGKAFAVTAK